MPKTTPWNACTAQRPDGSFCDRASLPDAPFPICVKHAAEVYAFLRGRVGDPAAMNTLDSLTSTAIAANVKRPTQDPAGLGVVYYVQVGELLKIGTTSGRVADRMSAYPPHRRLLAAEPGGYQLEAARLEQFKRSLVSGREWHRLDAELTEHLAVLRDRFGIPDDTVDWAPLGCADPADPALLADTNADMACVAAQLPRIGSSECDALLDMLDA